MGPWNENTHFSTVRFKQSVAKARQCKFSAEMAAGAAEMAIEPVAERICHVSEGDVPGHTRVLRAVIHLHFPVLIRESRQGAVNLCIADLKGLNLGAN